VSPVEARDAAFAEPTLPRANGAPVFDAPWQARAHAMAVLVVERTGRTWDDFRARLIGAVTESPDRPYWESWVAALDDLVDESVGGLSGGAVPGGGVPGAAGDGPGAC